MSAASDQAISVAFDLGCKLVVEFQSGTIPSAGLLRTSEVGITFCAGLDRRAAR